MPEVAPTPLQKHYINLSVIVLICGAIAITALELGARLGDPLIKLCVLIAAPLLVVTTADAVVRIWRSAWAWMPRRSRQGLFRLAWVAVSLVGLTALVVAAIAVLLAVTSAGDGRRSIAVRTAARPTSPSGRRRAALDGPAPELLLELRGDAAASARSTARTATACRARPAGTSPTSTRDSS